LLEHFQWDNTLKNRGSKIPEKDSTEMQHEVGDILIYLMKFCRETGIDIVDATIKKLDKIGKKYPVDYKKNGGHEEYLRIKKEHRAGK
jgi:NTP pyrophosphatase (non-canonical NTP hydrolase)